jgi:hypothetical protein
VFRTPSSASVDDLLVIISPIGPLSGSRAARYCDTAIALTILETFGRPWNRAWLATIRNFEENLSMPKALTISGLVVACLLLLLFGLDLAVQWPFGLSQPAMDIGFVICSLILAYLSWSAYRDIS